MTARPMLEFPKLKISDSSEAVAAKLIWDWLLVAGTAINALCSGRKLRFELFGGPERVRTVDLFHAMEARFQLRRFCLSFGA